MLPQAIINPSGEGQNKNSAFSLVQTSLGSMLPVDSLTSLLHGKSLESEIRFGIVASAGVPSGEHAGRFIGVVQTNSIEGSMLLPELNTFLKSKGFGTEAGKPELFTAAKEKRIFIATGKEDLQHLVDISGTDASDNTELRYPEQKTNLNAEDSLAVGQLDKEDAFGALVASSQGTPVEMGEAESFPLGDILVTQNIQKLPEGRISLHTKSIIKLLPKNDSQIQLIKNLERTDNSLDLSATGNEIYDSAFKIKLSHILVDTLWQGAVAELSPEQKKGIIFNPDSLSSLEIGGLPPTQEMLFPDLYLILSSNDPHPLFEKVKDGLQEAISAHIPMSNWLEKESEGIHMHYVNSPLGVGVYVAAGKKGVYITTSEEGLKKLVKQNEAIQSSNTSPVTEAVRSPDTLNLLISGSIDFQKIGHIAEELQGSFAMFTGGAQYLSNEQLVAIKSVGNAKYGIKMVSQDLEITWDQNS